MKDIIACDVEEQEADESDLEEAPSLLLKRRTGLSKRYHDRDSNTLQNIKRKEILIKYLTLSPSVARNPSVQ